MSVNTDAALDLIDAERKRQTDKEGWTEEHDDEHDKGELIDAAVAYLRASYHRLVEPNRFGSPPTWPWDESWWKPTPNDRMRELVKAGALIVAEMERLMRARARAPSEETK